MFDRVTCFSSVRCVVSSILTPIVGDIVLSLMSLSIMSWLMNEKPMFISSTCLWGSVGVQQQEFDLRRFIQSWVLLKTLISSQKCNIFCRSSEVQILESVVFVQFTYFPSFVWCHKLLLWCAECYRCALTWLFCFSLSVVLSHRPLLLAPSDTSWFGLQACVVPHQNALTCVCVCFLPVQWCVYL